MAHSATSAGKRQIRSHIHSNILCNTQRIPAHERKWISRNLFTLGPMLIGTFLLNYGWAITIRILWYRFRDTLYIYICLLHICPHLLSGVPCRSVGLRCSHRWHHNERWDWRAVMWLYCPQRSVIREKITGFRLRIRVSHSLYGS